MDTPHENLMHVTAAALTKESPASGAMKEYILRTIGDIEGAIKDAHQNRQSKIRFEPMTNFDIPQIDNKIAQRVIFSSVIEQLQKNGFVVTFTYTPQACFFDIRWYTDEDALEVERQALIIRQARNMATAAKKGKVSRK